MEKFKFLISDLDNSMKLWCERRKELLTAWSAQLKASLEAPALDRSRVGTNSYKRNQDSERRKCEYFDYKLKIGSKISLTQLRFFILITWYLDEEIQSLVYISLREVWNQRRLSEHYDFDIIMHDKLSCILYFQSKRTSENAFLGILGQLEQKFQKEVDILRLNKKSNEIFSLPFWRPAPYDSPNSYTGWARHQRKSSACDQAGSGSYLNFQQPILHQLLEEKKRQLEISKRDSLELSFGWIN